MMFNHCHSPVITGVQWARLSLCRWLSAASAHHDACHRLHTCPSDRNSHICGDKGRCDQCLDNQYCLAAKPRMASTPSPATAPPAPLPITTTTPSAVTACFTPGGELYRRHYSTSVRRQAHDSGGSLLHHLSPNGESAARRPHTCCAGPRHPR